MKIRMAETLAEVELTDHSKASIAQDGALKPLIQMLLDEDLEKKKVAIKCLMKLSTLPENGLLMLKEGAIGPLFEILYCHGLQSPILREQVAATIMHLSVSVNSQESESGEFQILESEDKVFKFFSLVSLTRPDTKQIILEAFIALCDSASGLQIRTWLRQVRGESQNPIARFIVSNTDFFLCGSRSPRCESWFNCVKAKIRAFERVQ